MNTRGRISWHSFWSLLALMVLLITALFGSAVSRAQETGAIGRLFITDADAGSYPNMGLRVYGYDGQGNPIDFSTSPRSRIPLCNMPAPA